MRISSSTQHKVTLWIKHFLHIFLIDSTLSRREYYTIFAVIVFIIVWKDSGWHYYSSFRGRFGVGPLWLTDLVLQPLLCLVQPLKIWRPYIKQLKKFLCDAGRSYDYDIRLYPEMDKWLLTDKWIFPLLYSLFREVWHMHILKKEKHGILMFFFQQVH